MPLVNECQLNANITLNSAERRVGNTTTGWWQLANEC
jgi:hypothetical protein